MQPGASPFKGQITEVDGLRGIAIFLVLVHHFWPAEGPWAAFERVAHLGWIGVDLFFVISGFLIGGILLDTRGKPGYFKNFYARRTLRIFPLYYLFLTVMFLTVPVAQHGSYWNTPFIHESGSPLWYYLYGGNIREALIGHEPAYYLAPLWSLSIEEQFYATIPAIIALISVKRLRLLLISLIAFAPCFRLATFWAFPSNERIQYLATFSRVDVISLGVLIALLFRQDVEGMFSKALSTVTLTVFVLFGALAFGLGGLDRMRPFCRVAGYSLVAFTFGSLVWWTIVYRGHWATGWLRFGPLTYLGRICYGVYLLQRPSESLVLKALPRLGLHIDPASIVLTAVKIFASVLVATLSWYLFEERILRLKKRFPQQDAPERTLLAVGSA